MGTGGGEEQTVDERRRPAQSGNGPEEQLLMELGRSAVDRAPVEVGIGCFHTPRRKDVASQNGFTEAGSEFLDAAFDTVDHG
jgi:hypothetical protein